MKVGGVGRTVRLLRYAALEDEVSAAFDAAASDESAVADFTAVVAEFGRMTSSDDPKDGAKYAARASGARVRDGSKTAAKLETRMRRRAERMALDVARHQELLDNRELRQARSLTRRWFVLGRALDAAMSDDPENAAALRAAIEGYITRPDELALLGWAREPDIPQS